MASSGCQSLELKASPSGKQAEKVSERKLKRKIPLKVWNFICTKELG
jgi:hypothetical protein